MGGSCWLAPEQLFSTKPFERTPQVMGVSAMRPYRALKRYKHTIIVGGTGMLCEASVELARRSESLTSIARTERSLHALREALLPQDVRHDEVAQDYNRVPELQSVIRQAIRKAGPVELLLAWIHDEDGVVPKAISEVGSEDGNSLHFVHVVGSAAAAPSRSLADRAAKFSEFQNLFYQQVVLGFHADSGGSRWLSNREVSAGVISAIENGASPYVVGQVRPWNLRPI